MAWLKRTYYCHGYSVPIIAMATAVRLVMMEELDGDKLDVRSVCESLDVPVSNSLPYIFGYFVLYKFSVFRLIVF